MYASVCIRLYIFFVCSTGQVHPGQGNKSDSGDMRSLSGGERSFSTVCFVLSLWAITEAPFRCLDEFDVYMVKIFFNLVKICIDEKISFRVSLTYFPVLYPCVIRTW